MRSGRTLKKLSDIQAMRDLCHRKQQELTDRNTPLSLREEIRVLLFADKMSTLDWVLGYETIKE